MSDDPELDRMMEGPPERRRRLGALQDLLLDACPPNDNGYRSIPQLARLLRISPTAVYVWIRLGRLSGRRAREILNISEGRVSLDDLLPFIR